MENIYIESTKYTPEILLDYDNGLIKIKGKSYPENTFEFYHPMVTWIEDYFDSPKSETLVQMEIIYFNSSSSKLFFDIFDLFEEHMDDSKIIIEWCYDKENESALEVGEEFIEDFPSLNIKLVPLQEATK